MVAVAVDEARRKMRNLEELLRARLEVDVAGMVAGVRARLEARLPLTAVPVPADLSERSGPFGWARVRSSAWEAPAFRKIVLTQVSVRPIVEGFALVAIPRPNLAAPVFACDLMALPTRVSVNADLYGSRELGASPRDGLQPLRENFARLGSTAGPAWAAGIGSGVGLHAKVSPRVVDDAFAALTAALGAGFDLATKATDGPGGDTTQRDFFEAFHEHGPRRGPLGKIFGEAWAERYSRLLFE